MLLSLLAGFYGRALPVFPAEGSNLHYRIIGFSFPSSVSNGPHVVEIAAGFCTTEEAFNHNKILSRTTTTDRITAEVPAFGATYTWRYKSTAADGKEVKSKWFHFKTAYLPCIDTNLTKLRILTATGTYGDAFVFSDHNSVLYSTDGQPVWFLPEFDNFKGNTDVTRDIKMTTQGTITLLRGTKALEISYDGKILWHGPDGGEVSGATTERYHHEFTRLRNGHYMVMGTEMVPCNITGLGDRMPEIAGVGQLPLPGSKIEALPFTTILEYDAAGKLVWHWKMSDFYRMTDIYKKVLIDPMYRDLHENSFCFDAGKGALYISLRNTSQVLKIAYPSGEVIAVHDGKVYGLFCYQHAVRVAADGSVYLFNNNDCLQQTPGVTMFREPYLSGSLPVPIARYELPAALLVKGIGAANEARPGGNAVELLGGVMFSSMCEPFANMFIMGQDQSLLWHAYLAQKDTATGQWKPVCQYRASIITNRAALENMIWKGRK